MPAVQLLLNRGSDPKKVDNYGNTVLHAAASNGHLGCVEYLANSVSGVNIWLQNIDGQTAREEAEMRGEEDAGDLLRGVEERQTPKKAAKQKEEAERKLQKDVKAFEKVQKKADKQKEIEGRKLRQELQLARVNSKHQPPATTTSTAAEQKRMSFSASSSSSVKKRSFRQGSFSGVSPSTSNATSRRGSNLRMTVLNKSSSVSSNPTSPEYSFGPTGGDDDVFQDDFRSWERKGSLNPQKFGFSTDRRSTFSGSFIGGKNNQDSTFAKDVLFSHPAVDRRDSLALTLSSLGNGGGSHSDAAPHGFSAPTSNFVDTRVDMLLAGLGLSSHIEAFRKEQIDMEALMLMNENELAGFRLPIGPRKKLIKVITERKAELEE